jgi:CRP-like cAMP-binding protein
MGGTASDIDWLLTAADSEADRTAAALLLEPHDFADGDTVFRQNGRANGAWLIEQGQVKLIRRLPGGAESQLALLGPGDVFGEVSLITNGGMRTTSAYAVGDTTLSLLPMRKVIGLAEQDDPIAVNMLRRLGTLVATRAAQTIGALAAGTLAPPTGQAETMQPDFATADFISRMPVGAELGYSGTDRLLEMGEAVRADEGSALDDAIYLIVRGAVRAMGGGLQVDICGPGRWLGTLGMASRVPAPLSYRALSTAVLVRIPQPQFEAHWQDSGHFARLLVNTVNQEHATMMRAANMAAGRASLMLG